MSYFDYYSQNVNTVKTEQSEIIKGTCYSMCPTDEVNLREREKMVHVLEVQGTCRRLVKSYTRSAADSTMAVPRLLRPYSVLKETVQYLLLEVVKRIDVPLVTVYDFINDRLRAVRQDMTIQRLPPEECTCLLDPMVRFYVYFGFRLRNYPASDFDPVLNKKYLLECLKWCLHCSDIHNMVNKEVEQLNIFMSQMDISKSNTRSVYDRVLMESLYILCNLDDIHPLLRYLGLSKELRNNSRLKLAYEIGISNLNGNYSRVCKQIEELCPISYCAMCSYLPKLQRQALLVLSHAYSSKQLTVPRDALRRWLRFSSYHEAQAVCRHYGLNTIDDRVQFNKADFKINVPLHQIDVYLPEKLSDPVEVFSNNKY